MKEIMFYRTYSNLIDEPSITEKRDFETIDLAKADALADTKNYNFNLFEITMIFDGKITERKKYLGEITCRKTLDDFEKDHPIKVK